MADERDRGRENRVEGQAEELKGKVRGEIGDATDDRSEQLKGKAEELKGKAKKEFGEAQEDIDRNI